MIINKKEYYIRQSGIEILKILAMFFIVIFHICQSVSDIPIYIKDFNYFNLITDTIDLQHIIMIFFRHLGSLGNNVFLICSFWFLCNSNKYKFYKIVQMIMDVWIISIIYLMIYLNIENSIPFKLIISSIFPNLFQNNWFISCYILVYMIHPFLNIVINSLSQKEHIITCFISVLIYDIVSFIKSDLFFPSQIIYAIVLYFLIAYIKKYMIQWSEKIKNNAILLLIGLGATIILFVFAYYFKLNIILKLTVNNNPFIIMTSIALFNLFKKIKLINPIINYVSSLSMIIYLIHENILFRNYTRIKIWIGIYTKYGYNHIIIEVLIYAFILFILSVIIAIIYKSTIQKLLYRLEKYIETFIIKLLDSITDTIMYIK